MSLFKGLQRRASENRPIRVGLIGSGKFGSMYLSQAPRTPGVHLIAVAELSHAEIAAEVNGRLDGARATAKSVRWYASRMRKRGDEVPSRKRKDKRVRRFVRVAIASEYAADDR